MIEEIYGFFNQGWVGSLIGLLGLLVGAAGIFSYRISKSVAQPAYQQAYLKLIGGEDSNLPGEVKVYYQGSQVNRLAKNKVIFWNNGTEVLDREAFVASDPLKIAYGEGTKILSFEVLKATRSVINFRVHRPAGENEFLLVDFDYLDPRDGAVIEILHDGKERYPTISGTLKGIPKGLADFGRTNESPANVNRVLKRLFGNPKVLPMIALLCGLTLSALGMAPPETLRELDAYFIGPQSSKLPRVMLVTFGMLYAAIPVTFMWLRRKKYPKTLQVDF